MKRRIGLISNSSSCSFTIIFDKPKKLGLLQSCLGRGSCTHWDRICQQVTTVKGLKNNISKEIKELRKDIKFAVKKINYLESVMDNEEILKALRQFQKESSPAFSMRAERRPSWSRETVREHFQSEIDGYKRNIKQSEKKMLDLDELNNQLEDHCPDDDLIIFNVDNYDKDQFAAIIELIDAKIIKQIQG